MMRAGLVKSWMDDEQKKNFKPFENKRGRMRT